MKSKVMFVSVLFIILSFSSVSADVPKMINYQGKITTPQGALIDTIVSMTFAIYTDSIGTDSLWSETQDSVKVEKGIFSVLLGSINPLPDTAFAGNVRYLGVKVGNDSEMAPRKTIVSVGYAFHSGTADTAYFSTPDADWVINGDNIYHLNGNVGIGTASPAYRLDIENSTDQAVLRIRTTAGNEKNAKIYITADDGGKSDIKLGDVSDDNIGDISYSHADNSLRFITNNTEKLRIDSNGNVGIGTTSPSSKLDVTNRVSLSSNAWEGLRIFPDGYLSVNWETGVGPRYVSKGKHMFFLDSNNDEPGQDFIIYDGGGTSTTATELFRVTETGNVGIGTTSPAYKLDVSGDIRSTGTIYGNFDGTISYALDSDKLDGKHNGEVSADIWDGHHWGDTYPNADKVDNIHGTQFVRNDQSGTLNGDLFVQGTSEGLKAYKVNVINATFGMGGPPTLQVTNNNAYNANPVVKFDQQNSGAVTPVLSVTNAGEGRGIYASTKASQNVNAAIYGDALDHGGVGVYGHTSSPGVSGGSSVGVFGLADNSGGSVGGAAFGVFGRCHSYQDSPNSMPAGIMGQSLAGSGVSAGVIGESHSSTGPSPGVYGVNTATTGGSRGVWGEVHSPNAVAVFGRNESGSAGTTAGSFQNAHGTYALISHWNGTTQYGILSNGTKSTLVQTSAGQRVLFCPESPEVWFEDFGEGELENGYAHIDLDALFLETVTISQKYPMKVFVQLNDDCRGVFVKRGNTGFDVVELKDGQSSAKFTYRVVAKRRGFEDKRLEKAEIELVSE